MRILLLGDTHRNTTFVANAFKAAAQNECEQIVQLGDFGYGWQWLQLDETLAVCKFSAVVSILVEKTGIGFSFIDGNHENFDKLESLPPQADGRREVAPSVFHLPRGHRFSIGDTTFLCCGGGVSLDRLGRTSGVSWWEREAITKSDVERCGREAVDVLLAHDMPIQCGIREDRPMSGFGLAADIDWYRNRMRVGEVVDATSPELVVHGHLHHRYERRLDLARPTRIMGLASDRSPLAQAAVIFDSNTQVLSSLGE